MFRVPNEYRVRTGNYGSNDAYGNNGQFLIPPLKSSNRHENNYRCLAVQASDDMDWEHVSVHAYHVLSGKTYTPYWEEMCYIKDLFWEAEDLVIQYHPPKSVYVNIHPNVLHLWRYAKGLVIPLPSQEFI
jgi:hypothetical protein